MGTMPAEATPWRDAWAESAYGAGGHWRVSTPSEHFRTATASTSVLARRIVAELRSRPQIRTVVELGAGEGALLAAIHSELPELSVYGVDLRERPAGLAEAVTWCRDLWDVRQDRWTTLEAEMVLATLDTPTLVLTSEWLDDLPCTVAQRRHRLDQVLVDQRGREHPGGPVVPQEIRWAQRWWPDGERVEIGLSRDRAWADAVARLRRQGGIALLLDYGHVRADRPHGGSLTGYRAGHQVPPVPDRSCNLTAHVAVDAVQAAGEQVGARTVRLARLADVVGDLPAVAETDPLAALVQRSERAALASPRVWGAQYWLLQQVTAAPAGSHPVGSGRHRAAGSMW